MLANSLLDFNSRRFVNNQDVRQLGENDRQAVIALLSENPLQGVYLRSMIEDNGFDHPSNRGSFYGYYENNRIVAVALLGHATMIYAREDAEAEALSFFAKQMVTNKIACSVVFGPQQQVEAFGALLEEFGRGTRMVRDFYSYVCQKPRQAMQSLQLRRANVEEAAAVAQAQAEMLKEATGTDPREADPQGFQRRVAERIERKRTWIKIEDDTVVFKTELQSVTAEVVYLEGVWTKAEHRSQGVAKACLTELTHRLLKQHLCVSLVVEPEEEAAIRLYEQIGYKFSENYQARYLKPLAD